MIKMFRNTKCIISRAVAMLLLLVMLSLQLMACDPEGDPSDTTADDNTTQEVTDNVQVPDNGAIITVAGGFKQDGTELYTNVTSKDASFDFASRIEVSKIAKWEIYKDADTTDLIDGKEVTLTEGENSYYIKVHRDENVTTYHAVVNYHEACFVEFYSSSKVKVETQMVDVGGSAKVPTTPVKTGFTFDGWYLDGVKYDFATKVNEDITLIAHWTKDDNTFVSSNTQVPVFDTLDASLHIVWKDYADNLKLRPESVKCILTQTVDGSENVYEIVLTEKSAKWATGTTVPTGAELTRGEGGDWTLYIRNLPKEVGGKACSYTLVQEALSGNYTTLQGASAVTNTIRGYVPSIDSTAALTTRNSRFYDKAGNMIVLNGVVTINVGNATYHTDISTRALDKLKAIGVNAIRVTAQIVGDVGYGYVYFNNGSARTGDYNDSNAKRHSEADRKLMIESLDYAIKNATELGMYIVIDWGILTSNPMQYVEEASEFFGILAEKHKDNPYVLFEICNEPQATWGNANGPQNSIKNYAEKIIEVVRSKGSDAIVIVAPNNCATALSAFTGPVAGDDPIDMPLDDEHAYNVAYTFHCYPYNYKYTTYSWKLRDAYEAGYTVVVTEFSPMDGTFDNPDKLTYDMQESAKYLRQFREYNYNFFYFRYTSMQYNNDSIANYKETMMFVPNVNLITKNWTRDDLTVCGKWFYDYMTGDGVFAPADFTTTQKKPLMQEYKDKYLKDFGLSVVFPGFAISAKEMGNAEFFSIGKEDTLEDRQYHYYCYLIYSQIANKVGANNVSGADMNTLPTDKATPMILNYRLANVNHTVSVMYGTSNDGSEFGITIILK